MGCRYCVGSCPYGVWYLVKGVGDKYGQHLIMCICFYRLCCFLFCV
ncbi:hypothetical protein [Hydrogenoanaerobacterium sp.]